MSPWELLQDYDNLMILLLSGNTGGSRNVLNWPDYPADLLQRLSDMAQAGLVVFYNQEAYPTALAVIYMASAMREV